METENKGKKEHIFDIYYVNRGIWMTENVEVTTLFPLLIALLFQNLYSLIISILLISVLFVLNKRGFTLQQSTRFISYFFKSNILPIDQYDLRRKKFNHLLKDGRNIPEYISNEKVNITNEKIVKKKLRA